MDIKQKAHKYLINKGCLSVGQTYTAFQVEGMLTEFAQEQVKNIAVKNIKRSIKAIFLDTVFYYKHGGMRVIREDFVNPKSEPFSNLCKRAEKEGLNYSFEDGVLTVWKNKIDYEDNYEYKLFWYDFPFTFVDEFEIK